MSIEITNNTTADEADSALTIAELNEAVSPQALVARELKIDLVVSNQNLERIYERLAEAMHKSPASGFYGGVWGRACELLNIDGDAGWRLRHETIYLDAEDIYDYAIDQEDWVDEEETEVNRAVIEQVESPGEDDDVDVFISWVDSFESEGRFVTDDVQRGIIDTGFWLARFLGTKPELPNGREEHDPENVAGWIVLVWTVLDHIVKQKPDAEAETFLPGAYNSSFLKAMDQFHTFYSYPMVSPPEDVNAPLWMLEHGYSAYQWDEDTDTAHIYRYDDYLKAAESSEFASLSDDDKLQAVLAG